MRIAGLLAGSLVWAAVSARPAAAQAPRIWITRHEDSSSAPAAKWTLTQGLIASLLGPSARSSASRGQDGRTVWYFEAAGWDPAVDPVLRDRATRRLLDLWGGDIVIANPDLTPSLTRGLPPEPGRDADHARPTEKIAALLGTPAFDGPTGTVAYLLTRDKETGRRGPYAELIRAAGAKEGVDPAVLRAVIVARSGFDPDARIHGLHGLMGISAPTARAYGYATQDLYDPEVNVRVGARLLASLLRKFDGDLPRALAAYEVGPARVARGAGVPRHPEARSFLAAYEAAFLGDDFTAAAWAGGDAQKRWRPEVPLKTLAETLRVDRNLARFRPLIAETAAQTGVDARLLEAMVMQENPWGDPNAVSRTGAMGLGQLMARTARLLGVSDRRDPAQNLRGMARHLKYLLERFHGDRVLAVAAYNCGEGPVLKARRRVPRIAETMTYVRRIMMFYEALTGVRVDPEPYMPKPASRSRKGIIAP